MLAMTDMHQVVDQEHQPGGDADHDADPAIGLWRDDERQDGRHDDRQLHPGVEALQEGGVAFRAGLAPPMLCFRGDIHGLDRARPACPGTYALLARLVTIPLRPGSWPSPG